MYCPQCNCEYVGWRRKCPVCQSTFLEARPALPSPKPDPLEYAALLDVVRQNGGRLSIDMQATEIETKRRRSFPYIGRGYAWARGFEGARGQIAARLATSAVGRARAWTFPYFGYGFAWEKEVQGEVAGNPVALKASKVARQRKMAFPYLGYGFAWVQAMSGTCGEQLQATLAITAVEKRRQWSFPYFGFGFAWASAGELILTLK